jgi:hypothetical protein
VPAQLARSAAQFGTETGEGFGLGVGDGVGLGLGAGLGLGESLGVADVAGERLAAGAKGPLGVHATAATRQRRRATPILT